MEVIAKNKHFRYFESVIIYSVMNLGRNLLSAIVLLSAVTGTLNAQGIHFSQAYSAHLTLSPANTGRFDGDLRAVGIFRNQGYNMSGDYQTAYFSFEMPFYVMEERLDGGLYYSHDNTAGKAMPTERINLSLAHGLNISHRARLHAGLQVGWVHRQIDLNKLSFPDQYNRDTGGFDPRLGTGENLEKSSTNYLDAGIGLLYSQTIPTGVFSGGYSMQQINRPVESFFGLDEKLPVKHVFHVKGDLGLTSTLFVVPAVVYMQMGSNNTSLAGLNLGYNLNEWLNQYNSVIAGVHVRNATVSRSRGLVFSAGCNWQYWNMMLAYDTDISKSRGNSIAGSGFEISVTYKLPSTEITQKTIQWERY